jgi:S1-C subfamily serine protease
LRAKSNRKRRKINAFEAKTTLLQRPLFSIGNGGIVPNSVLDGIISGLPNGLMRYVKDPNDPTASTRGISSTGLFQTNLNVNPGDSGGPVFNDRGEVIGIVTIGNRELRLGFVIPINYIIVVDLRPMFRNS